MRAVLAVALMMVWLSRSLAEGTATELASQLLRRLGSEEAAALKQNPPANDRVTTLRSAAEALRQHLSNDHMANLMWVGADAEVARWQGLLGDFPELVKLIGQWNKARIEEDRVWEKAACAEMEKVALAAVAKVRAAQTPAEVDQAIASLALLAGKYQYDRSMPTNAKGIAELLAFTTEVRNVLAAEQNGQRREALDRLSAIFRRDTVPFVSAPELQALRNEHVRKLGLPSTDQAEDAVRAIIAKAMAATKPAELDPLLEQLNRTQKLWEDIRFRDQETRTLLQLTKAGRQFVARWQDSMVGRARGDNSDAREIIKVLARTAENEPLYPRAKLLEIAAALEDVPDADAPAVAVRPTALDSALARIKTLDDLATQLPEIRAALENATGNKPNIGKDLERIEEAYVRLRTGDLENAKMAIHETGNPHPKLAELRGWLTIQLAAAALHGEGELAPHANEILKEYITRLMLNARQRKDWRRLEEIFVTTSQYPSFSGILNEPDIFIVRTFLAARNFDAAGVWPFAVADYIHVLASGSPLVPVEEITQRIDAIRREHPEDYQRGSDQASAAVRPRSR